MLKDYFNFLITYLLSSQSEIAKGAKISRASVNRLETEEIAKLALDIDQAKALHDYIATQEIQTKGLSSQELETKSNQIQDIQDKTKKYKKTNTEGEQKVDGIKESIIFRELLEKMPYDEAIEAAGHLSDDCSYIRVSHRLYPILLNIVTILELMEEKDALRSFENIMRILRSDLNGLRNKLLSSQNSEDQLRVLIESIVPVKEHQTIKANKQNLNMSLEELETREQKLKENLALPIGLQERLTIKEMLTKTYNRLRTSGKVSFSRSEAISLFLSTFVKTKTQKYQIPLSLRVTKYQSIPLSIDIRQESNYKKIYEEIFDEIAFQEELTLVNLEINKKIKQSKNISKYKSKAVEVFITYCIYHDKSSIDNSPEELEWTSVSNGTFLENAIASIMIHMGLKDELQNIHFLAFQDIDSDLNGLIESTVILKNNSELFVGYWVDRDNVICNLQSVISAALQWLSSESKKEANQSDTLNIELYKKTLKVLSSIRLKLFQIRTSFNSFKLFNTTNSSVNEQGAKDDIKVVEGIIKDAQEQLNKLPRPTENQTEKEKIDYYLPYRLQLKRCVFHANLILLRKNNVHGNLPKAGSGIDNLFEILKEYKNNINSQSNKPLPLENNELLPLEILLNVERYLYEFSSGDGDFVFSKSPSEKQIILQEYIKAIPEIIGHTKFYKEPGMDIYQSLAEINGIIARLNFYLLDFEDFEYSVTPLSREEILDNTRRQFLTACYHSLRIGFRARASRWVAYAGRTSLRLGKADEAQQAVELSKAIIDQNPNIVNSLEKDGLLSETALLEGELAQFNGKIKEALTHFFCALIGGASLGLNRRVCDALYSIGRCAEHEQIKNALVKDILEGDSLLAKLINNEKQFDKDRFNPHKINVLDESGNLLSDLILNENLTWAYVSSLFFNTAQSMWQKWYQKPGVHPVAKMIEERKWLAFKLKSDIVRTNT